MATHHTVSEGIEMRNRFMKCLLLFLLILFIQGGVGIPILLGHETGNKGAPGEVRPAAFAGSFYPASESQLREMISSMLNNAPEVEPEGEILAAMAPHAGYVFSGNVAACTFRCLSKLDVDTLVIIGHDSYQKSVAFTCSADYFQTPLGNVPVDREMIRKMHQFNGGIKNNRLFHARDQTIEIQLPFLQVLGLKCKIVPILFGYPTLENCRILSEAIFSAGKGKKVFILASTDMSHYPSYESANRLDNSTLNVLKSLDVNRLFTHLTDRRTLGSIPNLQTALCAMGGVGTAILYSKARGANYAQILRYANSGDTVMGDKSKVVGYSSVLFVKREP